MEKVLTVEEAAAVLRVDPVTMRRWLREGRVRGVKVTARAWRVPESALRELLSGDLTNGAAAPSLSPLGRALQTAAAARDALHAATLGPLDAARDLEEVRAGE